MTDYQAWHQQRHEDILSAQGDISLIAMYDITARMSVQAIPGVWEPVTADAPGLRVTATKEDGLSVNGQLIDGTVTLIADETVIAFGDSCTAMATSQPESLHLLAVWDTTCEARASFCRIDTYEPNAQFIIEGTLQRDDAVIAFSHTADNGQSRAHASIGTIDVTIGGQTYALRPFQSGDYAIVVFRDATSGADTYGMGRMVIVEQLAHDRVKLDFNRAFLPPCAFSPHFNCPMPPFSNRIQTAIEAGEKNIIYRA
ncbi:DUF1684 domain-containing protein [Caryophanon tenue]|uniref:DUF1684 domain-containing protein n=1 Tax=Caryophanon tenue TaxID=33978 RepID=A0A1C0YNC9_9BACL|nr:DUF1684 domain-containing protein [Caryophanon tenue]OCS88663.1 hypothetical protein A6M13_02115 [Caryophanon tenue]